MAWLQKSKSKKKKILIYIILLVFVIVGNYPITRGAIGQIIDEITRPPSVEEPDVIDGKIVLNYGADIEETGPREGIYRTYSYPKYYKDDNEGWQKIDTNIRSTFRPGYNWEMTSGLYKVWIKTDGTFTIKHWDDERSYRLSEIVAINEDTSQELTVSSVNFSSLKATVEKNSIQWRTPVGMTYKIELGHDQVRDIVVLPENLKNVIKSFVSVDWSNAFIGFKYEMSVEQEGATINLPKDKRGGIFFRDITTGNITQKILPGTVKYGDYDPVYKSHYDSGRVGDEDKFIRRKTIKDGYFYDYVPAEAFDEDTTELKFNDTKTFGDRSGADYAGTQDNYLNKYTPNQNNGRRDDLLAGSFNFIVTSIYRSVLAFDLDAFEDAHPNAEVTAAQIDVTVTEKVGDNQDVYVFGLLQDYGTPSGDWDVDEGTSDESVTSGEVCWNYRRYSTAAWNTAGADSANAGVDGDDSGDYDGSYDRSSVVYSLAHVTGTGAYTFELTLYSSFGVDVIQTQLDNPGIRYGFLLIGEKGSGHHYVRFASSEHGTASYRPQLEITYTEDTCGCPTGQNWEVYSSDNCFLSSDCDLDKNTLYLIWTGSGSFNIINGATLSLRKIESTSTPINVESSSGVKINFK